QATGASPQKGHLLEIGWIQTRAAATVKPETLTASAYQIALPPDVDIPPAVQRITGITRADSERALPAAAVWHKLIQAANGVAVADQTEKCPLIIHYARFEEPFLRDLHVKNNRQGDFPFQIICTHEIARRLLPGLPRRGLRAVAGYFGHTVPRQRRSGAHAVATAVIWPHFVRRLQTQHGIRHLDQLADWLNRTRPQKRAGRDYPMKPKIRLNLPDKPGIYRMLRSNGDLLYIGKATSLKRRVSSYFRQKETHAEHTLEMLSQAADLDVTLTGSALEAAMLESDEIKRLNPPYNVALQTGRRKLAFCSADLQKWAARPDAVHCIGPLPDGKPTAAITAFAAWHKNIRIKTRDPFFQSALAMLRVSPAYAPQPDCLAEGLALFRRNHRNRLKTPSAMRILVGLGRELWRERLRALEKARSEVAQQKAADSADDRGEEIEERPSWTPESVARGIEHSLMHGALLVRRARWLCLLSECSLAWQSRNAADHRKTVLLFESGAVSLREELPAEKETPVSAGYARRIAERQKIFDVTRYERLRVVTTELRRLVGEGRKIELRLNPTTILCGRQLARLLPWV
ncbi:MAG: GIY-YIG nuclease family protein, partial [Desulfobacterales bacterium]